ncbi:glutamine-hydrolyzing GMP synthase [Aggregatibacter actinomycetemcomitans]|uniref:glutamine-hydrolyzing GMP synthase n=1 Tax=Aggregatibacter actinomycetemcomitans TaxID=714 RepID=UPI00022AC23D|nr:glutamine-hydrolyzing GMP synthase [Aggregatibacter actinomycetemcomitans]KOE70017.1 GMP synthase [Aggregatibacter actinomycetemcomitans serotype f str. D18P1]KYK86242.1 GMP synthase [Aggregatibacter actinomycetemcomitans serotype f str. SC29R]MBN6061459.1 glutamine-hydrolyzing GMP synthase [Aggregatibacter actinomycetemcomitans]OZV16891.1 glutamine-hydrolyzing GMP synthase [Aggregatibacter actinomycetemcomitans]UEL52693.1 glutamine-hydrolyzing GMP synthase [Aggregatibacter actinomycetemcom
MTNIHNHKILILDFGSQYTQLIARRVREIGVYCELWAWDVTEQQIRDFNPTGIILSGGPESTTEENSPRAPEYVFHAGVPVLGICYGMQTMAMQLGGLTETADHREFGYASVLIENPTALFAHLNDGDSKLDVWMSHGDKVTRLPKDFQITGTTPTCPIAAMSDENRRFYGVQFHPEVTHTKKGLELLTNFVVNICGCETKWTAENIIEDAVARIKAQVGDDEVILGLSGGVDSSVVALLLHRAIGKNLHCVFVDNGLLRLNEGVQVMEMFGNKFDLNITRVDAESRFLSELAGVSDPEAKRKIIGKVFVDVFDDESKKLTNVKWLAQGTIYPDVIESAAGKTGKAHVIKSHHNVGGLPDYMKLGLVEPLRELFKDEVRKIGLALGLPAEMINRHPFPGPGLGVRVLGEVKKEYCDLLRRADAIFIEELHNNGWYAKTSQAFSVFLPVKSVGVMGDGRKYDWVISLRAVETIDFMTAHWAHLPYDLLGRISNRIINEVNGISRVVYDISGKPPATIEWE